MIGRRSIVGLALLCAFALCAFAVQSAMAQVGTKAVNTTAVTCVKVAKAKTGKFEDAHCDNIHPTLEGEFEHEGITIDTTTEVEVTAEGAAPKLTGTLAGVNTEITCTTVKSVAGKSFLHNVETTGKHTVTGTVQVNFTGCTVVKPTKCKVKEPIITTAEAVGVEGLKPGGADMGVEFVGEGANKQFAELFFRNKAVGETCSLNNGGKPFLVLGSAIATGKVAQGKNYSGATAKYEDASEMQTLEIGLKKAAFEGTFTTTMSGAGGRPIALTTTT